MSNKGEENKDIFVNEEEENSTIFLTPSHENEKVKKTGMLKKIIACVLALVVIAGSALAIKLIIPEKETGEEGVEEITLTVGKSKDFPEVQFINGDTTLVFKAVEGEEYDQINARDWYIQGVDPKKIDYTKTAQAINALGGLKAAKKVSDTVDDSLYGFDTPKYVINFIAPEDAQVPSYTIKIGNLSPDNAGRYVTASNREGVYLVRAKHFDSFDMNVLDFANVSNMGQISTNSEITNDYYSGGGLIKCDKLEFYTEKIGKAYTIVSAEHSDLYGYDFISPEKRPCADSTVKVIIDFFANGVTGDGAYSYDATQAELSRLGLNKPDLWATIYVENVKRTVKAKLQEDGHYAVVVDDSGVIGKVSAESLTFKDTKITDYYNELMLFKSINTLKTMSVQTNGEKYDFSFTAKYDAESQTDSLEEVYYNGEQLEVQKFQDYYLELISLTAVEHNYVNTSGKTLEAKIYITYSNDDEDTDMKFYKISDSRYQVEINSAPMGLISASSYKNFIDATIEITTK
ncbi:MAG: DUF4340 domain-containing protein [Clostridia bacterium]|nr:DUF4340 domain-containing protein [Clostridia bacterium]